MHASLAARMALARTAALLVSVFSAGLSVGYGGLPAHRAAGLAVRLGLTPALQAPAESPRGPIPSDAPTSVARLGLESDQLRVLRSPEFQLFESRRDVPRPQLSLPAEVCGSGPERRVCSSEERAPGGSTDTSWLVGLRAPDLPVHASLRVERFFKYLTESTAGRKMFRSWLKRSGRYHDIVARHLQERGLPQDVEALAFVESGYSPTAVSSEGATGMWQFMAGTARAYGLAVDSDYDERRSVEKSTDCATRYLSDLYERFGSWELAFAAYDMGYGRLTRQIQDVSTNDYWTLSLVPGALPDESLAYVPKVLAVALVLRNLDRFGFDDVPMDPPLSVSDMEVPGGTPLWMLARAAGTSVDQLRTLNPEILSGSVPDRLTAPAVHLPSRGLARASTMLPRLLSRWRPQESDERVDDGFDWGTDELAPARGRTKQSGLWNDPLAASGRATSSESELSDEPGADDPPSGAPVVVFYRVDDGETLAMIARRFGVRASRIVADNHLDPVAKLQKGMLLRISAPRAAVSNLASVRELPQDADVPAARAAEPTEKEPPSSPAASPPLPATPAAEHLHPSRVKHPHGGHVASRSTADDLSDLFARAKR